MIHFFIRNSTAIFVLINMLSTHAADGAITLKWVYCWHNIITEYTLLTSLEVAIVLFCNKLSKIITFIEFRNGSNLYKIR